MNCEVCSCCCCCWDGTILTGRGGSIGAVGARWSGLSSAILGNEEGLKEMLRGRARRVVRVLLFVNVICGSSAVEDVGVDSTMVLSYGLISPSEGG